jgi:hypothetical protein
MRKSPRARTLRYYQADIEIEPIPDKGTSIHWHGAYSTRWGMGWLMRPCRQRYMQRMADGPASQAEKVGNP